MKIHYFNQWTQAGSEPHLQPGPVDLWPDKLGQLNPHFPLLLHRVEDGVEDRDGAFVLQQRHIHHTLQGFKGSVFSPVLHNVDGLAAPQELDAGQLWRRGGVEQLEDYVSLLGGVARVQGPVVDSFAGLRGGGGEGGVQGLEARHGDPAPPATCALEIPQLQLREGAVLRAAEQARPSCILTCRGNARNQPVFTSNKEITQHTWGDSPRGSHCELEIRSKAAQIH